MQRLNRINPTQFSPPLKGGSTSTQFFWAGKTKKTFSKLLIFLSVFFFISITTSRTTFGDTITIASDEYCPFNCDTKSEMPGFMIEFANVIFERAGHKIEYMEMPWARSILLTRDGKYNAIVGSYVEDAPDFIFPENEQGLSRMGFFVKKGAPWRYTGIQSLQDIRVGTVISYSYGEILDEYFSKHRNDKLKVQWVGGDLGNPLKQNTKKLLYGRIDTFIEEYKVFAIFAEKQGIADKIELAGYPDEGHHMYIAFSPKLQTSKKYAKILSDGMIALRKSGELEKIMNKYGFSDWR